MAVAAAAAAAPEYAAVDATFANVTVVAFVETAAVAVVVV